MAAIYPVRDFDRWKRRWDESARRMAEQGAVGHAVYQAVDDAAEVMILFEVTSLEQAQSLMRSPDERQPWLDEAGVDLYPSVFVGRLVERIHYDREPESGALGDQA